tara:strand:- start:69 stop:239 length:171 start_codon:yes stop_codon:yes gene_type:complete
MVRKYKPNTVPLIPTGRKDKDGNPIMMEDWRKYKGPYAKKNMEKLLASNKKKKKKK